MAHKSVAPSSKRTKLHRYQQHFKWCTLINSHFIWLIMAPFTYSRHYSVSADAVKLWKHTNLCVTCCCLSADNHVSTPLLLCNTTAQTNGSSANGHLRENIPDITSYFPEELTVSDVLNSLLNIRQADNELLDIVYTQLLHRLHGESRMLAEERHSSICLHRMCSGTALSVGCWRFGRTQSPTYNHGSYMHQMDK